MVIIKKILCYILFAGVVLWIGKLIYTDITTPNMVPLIVRARHADLKALETLEICRRLDIGYVRVPFLAKNEVIEAMHRDAEALQSPDSMYALSRLLSFVKCAEIESTQYLRAAAEGGCVPAMIELGDKLICGGSGVQKDEAREWYSKAEAAYRMRADAGEAEAQYELARVYLTFSYMNMYASLQGKAAKEEGVRQCRRAAEQGHIWAMWFLTRRDMDGKAFFLSAEEAQEWEMRLFEICLCRAEDEDSDALIILGCFYDVGNSSLGIEKDSFRALRLFKRATEAGNSFAPFFWYVSKYNRYPQFLN